MNNLLDKVNILVVIDSRKDIISFLKTDYLTLINIVDLSTLPKTEYLSFTFFNVLKFSIVEQAQVYLKADLVLLLSTHRAKTQSADICNFINKPFINIRI